MAKKAALDGAALFCALGAAGAENGKRGAPGGGGAFWCAVLGPMWEFRLSVHGCIKIIAQFGPLVKALPGPRGSGRCRSFAAAAGSAPRLPRPPSGGLGDGRGQGGETADGQGLPERGEGLHGVG